MKAVRIASTPAFDRRFRSSSRGDAFVLWSGGTSTPFLKQHFDRGRFVVRYTPTVATGHPFRQIYGFIGA